MSDSQPDAPLLTIDEVRGWAVERDEALARVSELDRKLQGVRLLFPELAAKLFGAETFLPVAKAPVARSGPLSQEKRDALPLYAKPITDVVMVLIEDENGGRPPRWFRDKMMEIPGLAERVDKNPNAVGNALLRLYKRKKLSKRGDNYYLPAVLSKIEGGEIEEELADVRPPVRGTAPESFNSLMHKAMKEHGKPFKAADAIEVAKRVPELKTRLDEQPSRVYSWLTREISKHKLVREGGFYFYPPKRDEALTGESVSASFAGEGATSLFDNVTRFPGAR